MRVVMTGVPRDDLESERAAEGREGPMSGVPVAAGLGVFRGLEVRLRLKDGPAGG